MQPKGYYLMSDLFNIIGYIFGYVLWYAYLAVGNFAVAILIFTVILRIFQFPLQIKSQKSMAGSMRLSKKQQEIQEKYGRDREKINEELTKLYEKENLSPTSGCVTTLVPMFLLMGVYWTVRNPITNTLHIAKDTVTKMLAYGQGLPVVGSGLSGYYGQVNFMSIYNELSGNSEFIVKTGLTAADMSKLDSFARGFKMFGLNLLEMPSSYGIKSVFILFPVLCFVTSFGTSLISMKMNGTNMSLKGQQGCMNSMFLLMPLMSAWIAYSVPAAIALYWIYSNIIGLITTVIIHKFYNADAMNALDEARRIALLEEEELSVKKVVKVIDNSGMSAKPKKKKKK